MRVAIFVEGQTELIFSERLLGEYLGYQNIEIRREREHGDRIVRLSGGYENQHASIFILLVNCEGDDRVISAIENRSAALVRAGYDLAIGVRDLHPLPINKLSTLNANAIKIFGSLTGIRAELVVAVMEIEAWFLADSKLPLALSANLTSAKVLQTCGFDLISCNLEDIRRPSIVIGDLMETYGPRYRKRLADSHHIAASIDYENLCIDGADRSSSFGKFLLALDLIAS